MSICEGHRSASTLSKRPLGRSQGFLERMCSCGTGLGSGSNELPESCQRCPLPHPQLEAGARIFSFIRWTPKGRGHSIKGRGAIGMREWLQGDSHLTEIHIPCKESKRSPASFLFVRKNGQFLGFKKKK